MTDEVSVPEGFVSTPDAVKEIYASGFTIEEFIREVMAGNIRPRYRDTGEPVSNEDLPDVIENLRAHAAVMAAQASHGLS